MSDTIKQNTLNLFLDNIINGISAKDMRDFVENVWADKENPVRIIDNMTDLSTQTLIEQNDFIACKGVIDPTEEGIYIALIDNPTLITHLQKINSQTSEIPTGNDGQFLTLDSGNLAWTDKDFVFRVVGTEYIDNILLLRPAAGTTYIAKADSSTAAIPGLEGDGYTYDGFNWTNIGQLRGPEAAIPFASFDDAQIGEDNTRVISPYVLSRYTNKRLNMNLGGVAPTHIQLVNLLNLSYTHWQGKQFRFILLDAGSVDLVPTKVWDIVYIPQGDGTPGSAGSVDKFYLTDITSNAAV